MMLVEAVQFNLENTIIFLLKGLICFYLPLKRRIRVIFPEYIEYHWKTSNLSIEIILLHFRACIVYLLPDLVAKKNATSIK